MKKFMLAALVFAAVGGALAFNSDKAFNGKYKCRTDGIEGACPVSNDRYKITQAPTPGQNRFCNNGTEADNDCINSFRTLLDAGN